MKNLFLALIAPLRWLFIWLMALIILFEEWGWEPLQRLLKHAVQLLGLHKLELWLSRLPPYAALVALAVPSILLLPAKFAALALISQGHVVWGGMVFVAAKLIGTAVIARIFSIVQPKLMQLAWFSKLYLGWKQWKDALLDRVRATRAWQQSKAIKARVGAQIRKWLHA